MKNAQGARTRSGIDEGELHAFVDGRLTGERRAAVLAHLLLHSGDRERVEAYRRQLAGLARIRAGLDRYGEGFAPELQRALVERIAGARRHQRWLRLCALGLAAGLLFGIGVWTVREWAIPSSRLVANVFEPDFPAPEFPFGDAFGREERRVDGDREHSLAWFASHLRDQTLEIPDLRELGLVPVGGQVLDRARTPAVRLAWSDGQGGIIDLYVGVVASDADQAFTMVGDSRVALHWRRGRLVFALVGPAGSPHLLQAVQSVLRGIDKPAGRAVPAGEAGRAAEEPRPIRAVVEPEAGANPPALERPAPSAPAVEPATVKGAVPAKTL
ncbi:MAG: hypothetical protein N2038_02840 [Geminicoccaceae bacterium]|nr:hypothetical protein [Geminicoccaceae bacterium]